jgi:hypothetical protein
MKFQMGALPMARADARKQSPVSTEPPIMRDASATELETALSENGPEIIRELIHGLKTIRYGSIALTLHDGRLVEINKTVKIRPHGPSEKQ